MRVSVGPRKGIGIRKSLGSGERNGVGRPAVGAAVARPEIARQ